MNCYERDQVALQIYLSLQQEKCSSESMADVARDAYSRADIFLTEQELQQTSVSAQRFNRDMTYGETWDRSRVEAERRDLNSGETTANELRAKRGLPPLDGGPLSPNAPDPLTPLPGSVSPPSPAVAAQVAAQQAAHRTEDTTSHTHKKGK